MLFDEENEHEPDQPEEPGPGDIGPSIPEAKIPEAPNADLADRDVPKDLLKQFWKLVLIFNVALLAMSLGVMLIGFEGRWMLGGGLLAVGVVSFLRGWIGYKRARKG